MNKSINMKKHFHQLISQSLFHHHRHLNRFLGFPRSNFPKSLLPPCTHFHATRGRCSSPQQPNSNPNPTATSDRVSGIVNELMNLTLLESADLTEVMRKKMGINEMPIMAVMMPGMGLRTGMKGGGAGGAGAQGGEEKSAFDLKLEGGFDSGAKIKIIKEVRTFTDLGLKEAKELVEKAPTLLKKGVPKEEAEKIIEKMKGIGAKVIME